MSRKGYGLLITKARGSMSPEQLGERIGQSGSTVRRLENEETMPSVEQINALVRALPISAEMLLEAMGVNLSTPLAARLPRQLVEALAELTPEQHQTLLDLARWTTRARART